METETLGPRLRRARTEQGLALWDVAFDLAMRDYAVDAGNISRIERDRQHPSLRTARAIGAALGISEAEITALWIEATLRREAA